MTELLLIRHGQSLFNAQHRWASWEQQSSLTAQGEAEALALAERLASEDNIDAIYTSPLLRAQQTAQIIAKALALTPIALTQLREVNVGQVGGLTDEEFAERFPEAYKRWQNRRDVGFTWPGGENRYAFFRRAAEAVEYIASTNPNGKVVVVCHGGVVRATLAHFLPNDYSEWWTYALRTGSLTRLLVTPKGNELLTLNGHDLA